jgi:hypothetical protein
MSYWLERLEELGEQKLADTVRHSLPSAAKKLLREALEKNEREYQAFILQEKYSHHKFDDIGRAIKGAIEELTNRGPA